jgi:hypothetical protein
LCPLIRIGHWVIRRLFCSVFLSGIPISTLWFQVQIPHTHLILFQHICLWVMILFHDLSCCLRTRDSSVGIVIIQYKPTKCTFPKLIFYHLYQLPRPQNLTYSSTYKTACTDACTTYHTITVCTAVFLTMTLGFETCRRHQKIKN